MAGLVPAIHVYALGKKDMDARDKPAHDALPDLIPSLLLD